jgi:hypothetical protein
MTTATKTVRQIVSRALFLAGVSALGEEPDADAMAVGMESLDAMLKAWQVQPWMWTRASGTLTLTTAASYTLDPVRPIRILSARLKRAGVETPMHPMTRGDYDDLPLKTSTGLPTQYHYDRQREAAVFYVWPVLAAANGEQVVYTYVREVADITSPNETLDAPAEWYECVSYGLAARLADEFERPESVIARLTIKADRALLDAAAGEMVEPVQFMADYW